jgi:hypothetical protein
VTDPQPTAEQFAAVKSTLSSGTPGVTPPPEADMAAAAKEAGADPTTVDVTKLLAGIQAQQAAMQKRIDELLAEKASGAAVPVQSAAENLRDLVQAHARHTRGPDFSDVLRLSDDAVDAASNAASSGDGGAVTSIAAKLTRALKKVHPGPGDHHYFKQALDFAEVHLPDAADGLTPQANVPAVTSSQPPAKVISGSVTG